MSSDEPEFAGGVAASFRTTLGKVGTDKAQRLLNILLEAPFFYRDDDVDLFGLLRRRSSLFKEFFETYFGWDLYVDQQVARLIKPKTFNPQLRPSQRHVFQLTGRNQYVLFVLLLEFYQHQADEQNVDLERVAEVRFVLSDFVEFAFKRYREELNGTEPDEMLVLNEMRSLFKKLELHRFIAVAEKSGIVAEEGLPRAFSKEGASSVLYALLPGMRCYRPEALNAMELFAHQEPSERNKQSDVPGDEQEESDDANPAETAEVDS